MPNSLIECPSGQWTQVVSNNPESLTFQVQSLNQVLIYPSASAVDEPDVDPAVGIEYGYHRGEVNTTIAALFPGFDSPLSLWAYVQGDISVSVFLSYSDDD